jgi:hypothetical protein
MPTKASSFCSSSSSHPQPLALTPVSLCCVNVNATPPNLSSKLASSLYINTSLIHSPSATSTSGLCSEMSAALRTSSLRSLEERRLSRNRKSGSGLKWEPEDDEKKSIRELLPDDRHKLDALMNYHLGELDRLKKFVVGLNDDKEQHEVRLGSAKHRADGKRLLKLTSTGMSNVLGWH